jgi:hypothetical protein
MSVTRVGFEPDLAGLKDQQPHQKLNEPCCFSVLSVRTFYAVVHQELLPRIFATASVASLRVDWEVLEPSSSVLQTDAIPSQLPVHLLNKTLEIGTKKPGVAQRRHRVTNVVRRLQSAECHLRLGCPNSKLQGSIFAFCNTMPFLQS